MKYFNSIGPNPRAVRIFMAERGVSVDTVEVDLFGGENRQPEYMKVNPTGTTPALVTDSGEIITEITAICEYLDEVSAGDSLIGATPEEKAECRMWTRRADLMISEPLYYGYRCGEGHDFFKPRRHVDASVADGMKGFARVGMAWLDEQLTGRTWLCGDRFSMADIMLFCVIDFGMMDRVNQKVPEEHGNIHDWYERMKARPSTAA